MRTVETSTGKRVLLLSQTDGTAQIRDPTTGTVRTVDAEDIEPLGESALSVAAEGVPESVRRVLTAVHTERSLGLLVTLADEGPTAVVDLLSYSELCESDFNGVFGELRAAGLVEACQVAGTRGYKLTPRAEEAVEILRPNSATELGEDD